MTFRSGARNGLRAAVLACLLGALMLAGTAQARVADETLSGAGSSLVGPLVSVWQAPFKAASGITVNYNPIGSGGGIQAITSRQVDFGASDAPLTPDQFTAAKGVVQIPWALTATGIVYNVPNAPDHLKLTPQLVAAIYLGQITTWNAAQIKALNPGVNLPSLKITPVYRSDGSGDTFAFTDLLSKVSPTWKSKVGNSTLVQFPTGVGGKGNSGVSGVVASTSGSIGYVSDAYILQNHLKKCALRNNAGKFELPGLAQIASAASTVKSVPANNQLSIVNPPASAAIAYPLSTFTYIIVPTSTDKANSLKKFVNWAITSGQQYGPKLIFAPLPAVVKAAASRSINRIH